MVRRLFLLALLLAAGPAFGAERFITLASTTSTEQSGLFAYLLPIFEKKTGIEVRVVAVGTGQALAIGTRGDADALLVHDRIGEDKFVASGDGIDRRDVMYNDFVIIGPAEDPAKVKGVPHAVEALRRIAESQSRFVSRGDKSGTHVLEQGLWTQAGLEPKGAWYIESGQGMGQTLGIANERRAYTLTDRGTYLAFARRIDLPIMVERDRPLLNVYSVMEVNPANGPRVNAAGGKAFAEFMLAPETQAVIRTFGVDKYGQALFVPIAGKKDEDL